VAPSKDSHDNSPRRYALNPHSSRRIVHIIDESRRSGRRLLVTICGTYVQETWIVGERGDNRTCAHCSKTHRAKAPVEHRAVVLPAGARFVFDPHSTRGTLHATTWDHPSQYGRALYYKARCGVSVYDGTILAAQHRHRPCGKCFSVSADSQIAPAATIEDENRRPL
jgi:hypothetical protein